MVRITKSAEERKSEILDTAEKLFNDKGYEKTSTSNLASSAKIAQGTIYYHFESKDAIAQALIARQLDKIYKQYKAVAHDDTFSAMQKIAWVFIYEIDDPTQHVQVFKYLENDQNAILRQMLHVQTVVTFTPLITDIVLQGIDEGIFHTDMPSLTAEFFISTLHQWVDPAIFRWTKSERIRRIQVIEPAFEALFGVTKGAFSLATLRETVKAMNVF